MRPWNPREPHESSNCQAPSLAADELAVETGVAVNNDSSVSSTSDPDNPGYSRLGVALAYGACILIWGTTWFAVRQCVLPGAFPPFTACAFRFSIALVCLAFLFITGIVRAPLPDRRTIFWTVVCGVLSVGGFTMVYSAERAISGALAAIISTTTPIVTALLATVTKTEKVTMSSLIGAVIGIIGVSLIFGDRLQVSTAQAEGIVMIMVSVVLSTVAGVILKRNATNQNPFVTVATYMIVCSFSFIMFSILFEQGRIFQAPPLVPLLAATYLGIVGSIISFVCYFYLLKRISLMTISKMVFFPPLLALAVDVFFEKQVVLSTTAYIGIAITLFGVGARLPAPKAPRET